MRGVPAVLIALFYVLLVVTAYLGWFAMRETNREERRQAAAKR